MRFQFGSSRRPARSRTRTLSFSGGPTASAARNHNPVSTATGLGSQASCAAEGRPNKKIASEQAGAILCITFITTPGDRRLFLRIHASVSCGVCLNLPELSISGSCFPMNSATDRARSTAESLCKWSARIIRPFKDFFRKSNRNPSTL